MNLNWTCDFCEAISTINGPYFEDWMETFDIPGVLGPWPFLFPSVKLLRKRLNQGLQCRVHCKAPSVIGRGSHHLLYKVLGEIILPNWAWLEAVLAVVGVGSSWILFCFLFRFKTNVWDTRLVGHPHRGWGIVRHECRGREDREKKGWRAKRNKCKDRWKGEERNDGKRTARMMKSHYWDGETLGIMRLR